MDNVDVSVKSEEAGKTAATNDLDTLIKPDIIDHPVKTENVDTSVKIENNDTEIKTESALDSSAKVLVRVIDLSELGSDESKSEGETIGIKNSTVVTSFNWVVDKRPRIVIPGLPKAWNPPHYTPALPKTYDHDLLCDGRLQQRSNEAAMEAVLLEPPSCRDFDADIFACGNTMTGLLMFAKGEEWNLGFDVQRVGRTVFCLRKDDRQKHAPPTYRAAFTQVYTRWDNSVPQSLLHQRVIRYEIAGLQCVVNYECDGYRPLSWPQCSRGEDKNLIRKVWSEAKASSQHPRTADLSVQTEPLIVTEEGQFISQSAIFTIATSDFRNQDDRLEDRMTKMYVRQIPMSMRARHQFGRFKEKRFENMEQSFHEWETVQAEPLRKFGLLLQELVAISQKHTYFRLRRSGFRRLEILVPHEDIRVLPDRLTKIWAERQSKGSYARTSVRC